MECYQRGAEVLMRGDSHQYWQPLEGNLNGQSKSWSVTYMLWHTCCRQCFYHFALTVTCKEKMCGTVKQDFTLEEASQIWLSEQVTLKCEAWQNQPSSSWHFVWEVIKPNISKHFPKCLTVTLNSSTLCSGIYSPDVALIQPGGWWCGSNSEKQ